MAATVAAAVAATSLAAEPTQPYNEVKLFNRWTFEEVQVKCCSFSLSIILMFFDYSKCILFMIDV